MYPILSEKQQKSKPENENKPLKSKIFHKIAPPKK